MNWERLKNRCAVVPTWCWLVLILILGGILRLINIFAEPLWADEILSLGISHHFTQISGIISYLAQVEVHPPLYYIIVHFWTNWFGIGNGIVRLPSFFFGIGCIWVGYQLGKRIFQNEKIGLLTALLLAIFPLQIEFSQEARPYIIYCFFAGLAMLAIWEYLYLQKKIWLAVYVGASLVGLYLHYSFVFFLASLALFWFFDIFWRQEREKNRSFLIWFITNSLIVLGFSFWFTPLIYKLILSSVTIFGLPEHFGGSLRQTDFLSYMIDQIGWVTKVTQAPRFLVFVKSLTELAVVAAILDLARRSSLFNEHNKKRILFLFWLFFLPIFFFLFSFQSASYRQLIVSHIIFVSFPAAVFLAFVISQLRPKHAIVLFSLIAISVAPYTTAIVGNDADFDPNYQFQEAASLINQLYLPGDLVVVVLAGVRSDLDFYLKDAVPITVLTPINYFGLDVLNTKETLGLIENESNQLRYLPPSSSEIWLKLDRIDKMYKPKRYWVYGAENPSIGDWFVYHNFRQGFRNMQNIFELDSYSKR